jgi:hypothetical protein
LFYQIPYQFAKMGSGSILSGGNPLDHGTGLFLVQVVLIMSVCRLLGAMLSRFKQPSVIAGRLNFIFQINNQQQK